MQRAGAPAEAFALSALPPALLQRILVLLPVDLRARSAAVCRGWRATLADPSLWTRLDLSDAAGLSLRRVTDRVFCAAPRRARAARWRRWTCTAGTSPSRTPRSCRWLPPTRAAHGARLAAHAALAH
jgi:hypothetical protein